MAITKINVETFLKLASETLVIDVRSEGEFAHAHFPGAVSMPLFNNEERKIVGTAYKKESKQNAIKIGLDLFGKKMVGMVETVERLLPGNDRKNDLLNSKAVIVHCWRGGMRSGGVGWLLDLYGFKVYTLAGGYKAFRRWCIQQLEKDYPVQIVGGYTGSGKTYLLHEMKRLGYQVIDLEGIASHKGSAFGSIGMPAQASQEMFENLLATEMFKIVGKCQITDDRTEITCESRKVTDDASPLSTASSHVSPSSHGSDCIWLEDESQRIGLVNLPTAFYQMMRSKAIYFLDIPFDERLNHIISEYGKYEKKELINAIMRIQKRLGGLDTTTAVNHILADQLREGFSILLKYYDKQYLKGLHSRNNLEKLLNIVACETADPVINAALIVNQ